MALRVKMLVTRSRTERPRDLYYSLVLVFGTACVGKVGDCEAATPVVVESTLKYHSGRSGCLTSVRHPDQGQCLVGSLTGAVASQKGTGAPKGSLSLVGNQVSSVSAQGSLTVRQACRAGTKVGTSDPAVVRGNAVAQRIKGTPGITG